MIESLPEQFSDRRQQDRTSGAVIGTQRRVSRFGANPVAVEDWFAVNGQRDRVHVGHQQTTWFALSAFEPDDQIARVSSDWTAAIGRIGRHGGCRDAGVLQRLLQPVTDVSFASAASAKTDQIGHAAYGRSFIN